MLHIRVVASEVLEKDGSSRTVCKEALAEDLGSRFADLDVVACC